MNLKNKPPVFVPDKFVAEVERLSKATLMDMVWDYAHRCATSDLHDDIMAELRKTREIILHHRQDVKPTIKTLDWSTVP